jgi:hypothetical protein
MTELFERFPDMLRKSEPPSTARVLQECWTLEAIGKGAEAREALKRGAQEGIPLP